MLHLVINNLKKEHHNHNNPSKHNREVSGHNLAATQLNITTKRNCRIIILKFLKPNQLTPWCVWNGAVRELACNHHHHAITTHTLSSYFSLYPTKATNKHKTIRQPPNERLHYTFLLSLSPFSFSYVRTNTKKRCTHWDPRMSHDRSRHPRKSSADLATR